MTLREAALSAAGEAFGPIVQLLLEMGITSPEAEDALRAVFIAEAKRMAESNGEATKVRLAEMTGVHRNFISVAVKKLPRAAASNEEVTYAANRVLQEWFADTRFRNAEGEVRTLRLTGPRSFETLARENARRVDTKSVLDELVRRSAVEMVGTDEVRARGEHAGGPTLDAASVDAMGRRLRDLGRTLRHNQMRPSEPRLAETAVTFEVSLRARALLARTIKTRGTQFVREIAAELNDPRLRASGEPGDQTLRMGVTVFYFEDETAERGGTRTPGSQKSSSVVREEQRT